MKFACFKVSLRSGVGESDFSSHFVEFYSDSCSWLCKACWKVQICIRKKCVFAGFCSVFRNRAAIFEIVPNRARFLTCTRVRARSEIRPNTRTQGHSLARSEPNPKRVELSGKDLLVIDFSRSLVKSQALSDKMRS